MFGQSNESVIYRSKPKKCYRRHGKISPQGGAELPSTDVASPQQQQHVQYFAFTLNQKRVIVALRSLASFAVVLFLFLPETSRKVVGDGSVPPPSLNNSVTDMIRYRRRRERVIEVDEVKLAELRKNYRFRLPLPRSTFRVILDAETAIILLRLGLQFSVFCVVMTGATSSFQTIYHFNNIQTALIYLPIGCGRTCSAFTTGRIVYWNYRRHVKRAGMTVAKGVRQDLMNFNIERVRLEIALPMYNISLSMVIIYGWLMGRKVNIAAPIVMLFVNEWALNATSQVLSVLMVDLWPGNSAAATAAANLFRCELGAGSSAVIGSMIDTMSEGWGVYSFGAGLGCCVACVLVCFGVWDGHEAGKAESTKQLDEATSLKA